MTRSKLPVLAPNKSDGHHDRKGETIEGKRIEIGKGEYQDFLIDCTLVDCEIRILCGAQSVNLFRSTFEGCVFRPRQKLSNLRFNGLNLRRCRFIGRYDGCRFGNEEEEDDSDVRDCDFSEASLFDMCEFLDGTDVASCRFPAWPHIVVTNLTESYREWLDLDLPEELEIAQEIIGENDPPTHAVTLYLPSETDDFEELRPLLDAQPYIRTG